MDIASLPSLKYTEMIEYINSEKPNFYARLGKTLIFTPLEQKFLAALFQKYNFHDIIAEFVYLVDRLAYLERNQQSVEKSRTLGKFKKNPKRASVLDKWLDFELSTLEQHVNQPNNILYKLIKTRSKAAIRKQKFLILKKRNKLSDIY